MSPQTRDRWVGFWLALLLVFVYLLTHSWMYHSVDEMSVVSAAKTVLAGDGWHANQMEWEQSWRKSQTMTGLDGNLYLNKRGLAVAALILPWLAAAGLWKTVGAVQLALLTGPLVTALTGVVLYYTARRLKFDPGVAALSVLAWGLGTLAWPYSRTLFTEPTAALGLSLALYGAVTFRRAAGGAATRALVVAGCGLALLTLAKQANAVVVLPFAAYLVYVVVRRTPRRIDLEAAGGMGPGLRHPPFHRRGCHRGLQSQRIWHAAHAAARLSGRFQDAAHHGSARAAVQLGQGCAVARAAHLAGPCQRVLLAAGQTAARLPAGARHGACAALAVQRVVRLGRRPVVGAAFPGNRDARGGVDGPARAGGAAVARVAAAGPVGGRGGAAALRRDATARRPDQFYGAGGAGHRRRSDDPAALLDAAACAAAHVLARHRLADDRPAAGAARRSGTCTRPAWRSCWGSVCLASRWRALGCGVPCVDEERSCWPWSALSRPAR